MLWDNPFLIPLGALAMAGYAAHLESGSSAGLRVSIAAMVTIPLVHLMGIALVVPLAAHMLVVRGRALWAHKLSVGAIVAAALVLARPYWIYLAGPHPPSPSAASVDRRLAVSAVRRAPAQRPRAGILLRSGPDRWRGVQHGGGSLMAGVCPGVGRHRRRPLLRRAGASVARLDGRGRTSPASSSARIACQAVIDGISAKFEHPHYQNATWISFVLLAWLAVDVAERRRVTRWAAIAGTGLLAASLLAAVGALLLGLHRSGGTREIYGPTLANQQRGRQGAGPLRSRQRRADVA